MHDVAPNQNGFTFACDAEACVSDFMAGGSYSFNIGAKSLPALECFCAFVKTLQPRLGAEPVELFPGDEQARQLRECVVAIGKDQPVDMVEVRVGEGNRPNPVDSDVGFAERLRK